MLGITFHDYLNGAWEDVRGYLIEELEQIQLALQKRTWPVGSVFTTSINSDPKDQLGFGNWSLITQVVFPDLYMWKRTA